MSSKVLKLLAAAGLLSASVACSTESDVEITFYGYPDNDPPSADIAYDCGRGYTAGGMFLEFFELSMSKLTAARHRHI